MGAFDQVDIPGGQKLLADAGVTGPIDVRLKYAANNPRRANEYDLMKASAAQAGFNLIDGQSVSWSPELSVISGYDASLFGWQNTSTGIAESQANYVTTGGNNYGKYSNPAVDSAFDTITGSDLPDDEYQAELIKIEKQLVDDAFGTVIFQFPNV